MKKSLLIMLIVCFLTSCDDSRFWFLEAAHDNINYESITNSFGSVYTKKGDSTVVYPHAQIVYSETDQMSMIIKTIDGKFVYIQGQAVVEFDSINVRPQ